MQSNGAKFLSGGQGLDLQSPNEIALDATAKITLSSLMSYAPNRPVSVALLFSRHPEISLTGTICLCLGLFSIGVYNAGAQILAIIFAMLSLVGFLYIGMKIKGLLSHDYPLLRNGLFVEARVVRRLEEEGKGMYLVTYQLLDTPQEGNGEGDQMMVATDASASEEAKSYSAAFWAPPDYHLMAGDKVYIVVSPNDHESFLEVTGQYDDVLDPALYAVSHYTLRNAAASPQTDTARTRQQSLVDEMSHLYASRRKREDGIGEE